MARTKERTIDRIKKFIEENNGNIVISDAEHLYPASNHIIYGTEIKENLPLITLDNGKMTRYENDACLIITDETGNVVTSIRQSNFKLSKKEFLKHINDPHDDMHGTYVYTFCVMRRYKDSAYLGIHHLDAESYKMALRIVKSQDK